MRYLLILALLLSGCLTNNEKGEDEIFKEKITLHLQGDWMMEEQLISYNDCSNPDSVWSITYQYILEFENSKFELQSYSATNFSDDTLFVEGEYTILNSVESSLSKPIDTTLYALFFHDFDDFHGLNCETNYGLLFYGNSEPSEILLEEKEDISACTTLSREIAGACNYSAQRLVFKKLN